MAWPDIDPNDFKLGVDAVYKKFIKETNCSIFIHWDEVELEKQTLACMYNTHTHPRSVPWSRIGLMAVSMRTIAPNCVWQLTVITCSGT